MPQNTAVGAVYNPKGIPLTLAAASLQDWVMVQQNSTGRVGKMRISTLLGATTLTADQEADQVMAVKGEATLNTSNGLISSEELTDASEYVLTLSNSLITAKSDVAFEVTESPDQGTPEIADVEVTDGKVVATVMMDPPFTGTLVFNFTVSN